MGNRTKIFPNYSPILGAFGKFEVPYWYFIQILAVTVVTVNVSVWMKFQ
jgi:hypothetical protein